MLLLSLAWRNAQRNLHRTLLTAATVLLGTALLTVALSWMDGIFGSITRSVASTGGHVRVVQPRYLAREALLPLADHLPHADALAAAAREVPGVVGAWPRILVPVTLTKDETLGEHFGLVMGAPPAWFAEVLDLGPRLVGGRLVERSGEVVLGRAVADALGAVLDEEVLVVGQTQDGAIAPVEAVLVGVVSAGNQVVDRGVFLHLDQVRWLADVDDGATELLVYVDDADADAPEEVAAALGAMPGFTGLALQTWKETPLASSLFAVIGVIRLVLASLVVGVCALAVWNTMTMSVLERTAELGVLRAMGLGRLGVVLLCVVEAAAIGVVGGLAGVALGSVGAGWLEAYGVLFGERVAMSTQIPLQTRMYADWSVGTASSAFLLGLTMAVLGALAPAARAAAIQPVEAMRR